MTNLTETPTYEAGIYQLETTDPVVGGPNGIDNLQAKQLANRTAYLKAQLDAIEQELGDMPTFYSTSAADQAFAKKGAQGRTDLALGTAATESADAFSETTPEVVTAGQNWAGVAYVDPDAIGANPTAKIYPDGSVVGSTGNGNYTKYPNGDLVCTFKLGFHISSLGATGLQAYPVAFVQLPAYFSQQNVAHGDANYGRAMIWTWSGNTSSVLGWRAAGDDGITAASHYVEFHVTSTGKWK